MTQSTNEAFDVVHLKPKLVESSQVKNIDIVDSFPGSPIDMDL